jgi:hypothetical protein
MMLIGLQEWIMMKAFNKKMTTMKTMIKTTTMILMKISTTISTIELMKMN